MFSILITATFAITYALQWVIPLFHRQERLHKTLLTIQPYIFWAMFTGTIILTWRIILRTPTLTLFLLTPALIYFLLIALLSAAQWQEYRRTGRSRRGRQKSRRKKGISPPRCNLPNHNPPMDRKHHHRMGYTTLGLHPHHPPHHSQSSRRKSILDRTPHSIRARWWIAC